MKKEKPNITTEKKQFSFHCNVEVAFFRLIGPLTLIINMETYESGRVEYKKILSTITRWLVNYEKTRDLGLIHHKEILNIYEKLEKLKEKFVFDFKLGEESELSDEVVIWMWKIMNLRKDQIEERSDL